MFINTIKKYITHIFDKNVGSGNYGSALEAYIVSKNPQSTYEVEYLTRQFDQNPSLYQR